MIRGALLALGLVAACGGPSDEDKIRAVVDRMCECKDKACAERVGQEKQRVGAEILKAHGATDDAVLKLPRALGLRNNECARRAMTGEAQTPK